MSNVRIIIEGTTSDYDSFSRVAERLRAHVEAHEPGAVAYECFADETTGQVLWHERFEDADAFLNHITSMQQTGLMAEMLEVFSIQKVAALEPVVDLRVAEVLDQFGATRLHGLAGVVR